MSSSWLKISFWANKTKKTDQQKSSLLQLEEEEFYGITDQLVEFIKSLTLDTFKTFSLPKEEELDCEAQTTSGGVQVDLSDWQQKHAILILSKVKEIAHLRYLLCPRVLKERDFWRIYFSLVNSYVIEYELQAIRLEKLKKMSTEEDDSKTSQTNGVELEMSGPKLLNVMSHHNDDS